jgi:hypothetical protein
MVQVIVTRRVWSKVVSEKPSYYLSAGQQTIIAVLLEEVLNEFRIGKRNIQKAKRSVTNKRTKTEE